ncbi:MAG: hypothetical protein V1644_03440 [Candidatus Micrarchaeota archaeon]
MLNEFANAMPVFFKVSNKELEENLKITGFTCGASRYITACFLISFFSLPLFAIISSLLEIPLLIAVVFSTCVFIFLNFLPLINRNMFQNKIESQLPTFVYLTYLETLHNPLREKALFTINFPELATEVKKIETLLNRGLPLNLVPGFYKGPSKDFSTFVNLLASGTNVELKKFYCDLLEKQRNDLKKHAAKANLMSMFFISIAAIVPALFSAFVLLGPLLGFALTSLQILFIYVVLFPLLNLIFLYCIEAFLPAW